MKDVNEILKDSVALVKDVLHESIIDIYVERAVLGLFFSGVKLSTGQGGLCFTPIKEIPEAVCCPSSAKAMPLSGKLAGRPVLSYLDDIFCDNVLKKTLGIAALNALSALCWEQSKTSDYRVETGIDAFDEVIIPPNGKSIVIGALVPIIKKLIAAEADFKILEMDTKTLKPREMPYYAPPADAGLYLPEADLVVITGVTLLNDTLPDLLTMIKPGAQVIVTGPTASMIPDAFFSRGVTLLGGILVTKPDELLDIIAEGGSGYHFFGKSAERSVIRCPKNVL